MHVPGFAAGNDRQTSKLPQNPGQTVNGPCREQSAARCHDVGSQNAQGIHVLKVLLRNAQCMGMLTLALWRAGHTFLQSQHCSPPDITSNISQHAGAHGLLAKQASYPLHVPLDPGKGANTEASERHQPATRSDHQPWRTHGVDPSEPSQGTYMLFRPLFSSFGMAPPQSVARGRQKWSGP